MSSEINYEAMPVANKFVFRKMVLPAECEYIRAAREIMSDITGEDFTVETPDWLSFGQIPLQCDGMNERLKMMIDYEPGGLYTVPLGCEYIYDNAQLYDEFAGHISDARVVSASMAGYAICTVPGGLSRDDLRTHLRNWQHWLTNYRVWVGSPRCKCPTYPSQ